MICTDTRIQGIEIPGPGGENTPGKTSTLLERCLADDMAVGLAKPEMYAALNEQLERFHRISDHDINYTQSYALLLGNHRDRAVHLDGSAGPYNKQDPRRIGNLINWTTLERFSDKYHGIRLTDEPGAEKQILPALIHFTDI